MQCIELNTGCQVERSRHTSKGDQPKWQIDDTWYKADYMGYESLSEVVVSRMLSRSTLDNFVTYEPMIIKTELKPIAGCVSQNFRKLSETLISLERLHRAYQGVGLAQAIGQMGAVKAKIQYTVDFVEKVTGLQNFGRYLSTIMELDAFLLNEDRHTNNIAVIRNEETGTFRLCPIFDHGLSFLADMNDYPIDADIYSYIRRVKSKPFCPDFTEQIEAATTLYGSDLHFLFSESDIPELFQCLDELYEPMILQRANHVIREQMCKYSHLFTT